MKNVKPMGIFESVFDIAYLLFDLIAGIVMLAGADGRTVLQLYGVLALLLGAGDAFHLVPRVRRHLHGEEKNTERNLGLGLAVSSVTMTLFYLLLYAIVKAMGYAVNPVLAVLLFVLAAVRIVICFFPQNNWFHYEGNRRWSLYRNLPFALLGIVMIVIMLETHSTFGTHMAIAILISFGCYLPVTIWAKKVPAVGSLMMPKTLAYVWMIAMGLNML